MRSSTRSAKRLLALLAAGLLCGLSASALSDSAVTEGSRAAGLESCVAPTEDMRRNHMEYLKHQRDETVHEGIRGAKYSLVECVDCHASPANGGDVSPPINAPGEFCQGCHAFAAVSIDCFQCHRTVPRDGLSFSRRAPPAVELGSVRLEDLRTGAVVKLKPSSEVD